VAVTASRELIAALFCGTCQVDGHLPVTIDFFPWDGSAPASRTTITHAVYTNALSPDGRILLGAVEEPFPQVVVWAVHTGEAFTGSAATARALRDSPGIAVANARFNIEADSLNAAVLAPDAEDATFDLFVRYVAREMTQKSGQKCTAVRRIFVPHDRLDTVQDALAARLGSVVTGNPADPDVTMGPLATNAQLDDTLAGIDALGKVANRIVGSGTRVDGRGSPAGRGFFVGPTLFRADHPLAATIVHEREVFGPVATLMPYDRTVTNASDLVRLGGGMLVTSVHGDDADWTRDFILNGGANAGRLYVGSADSAASAPGSGAVFPQTQHGGPGRAGGGAELGGLVGLRLYMQRVTVQGAPGVIASVSKTD